MFARLSLVAVAFALLGAEAISAAPTPEASFNYEMCSGGSVQCCNSVQESNSGGLVDVLLGLLGVVIDGVIPIGVTCSPITVIGVSGTNWLAPSLLL